MPAGVGDPAAGVRCVYVLKRREHRIVWCVKMKLILLRAHPASPVPPLVESLPGRYSLQQGAISCHAAQCVLGEKTTKLFVSSRLVSLSTMGDGVCAGT